MPYGTPPSATMQPLHPRFAREPDRQWRQPELKQHNGQCAAENRGVDDVGQKMIEAEP